MHAGTRQTEWAHRRRAQWAVVAVTTAAILLLVGCSSSDTSSSDGATDAAPAIPFTAAEVSQTDTMFTVSWESPGEGEVSVYAGTDPEAVGRDRQVGTGDATGTISVTDLPDAPRWYFELVPTDGDSLVLADRSLHLDSAPNFRDVGGYRTNEGQWVRMGKLYRSDGLDELTPEGVATLQAIGVKLVCDLRTDYEIEKDPNVTIPGSESIQLNVAEEAADMTKLITDAILTGDTAAQQEILGDGKGAQLMIDAGAEFVNAGSAQTAYQGMYERIADPAQLPTVFNCTAGKDRTGWAAASFLSMLGVPRETVMQDYLLSNDKLAEHNQATLAQVDGLIDPALLEPVLGVREEYLQSSFETVDAEYGSIDAYLSGGLGLPQSTVDQLRKEFLAG